MKGGGRIRKKTNKCRKKYILLAQIGSYSYRYTYQEGILPYYPIPHSSSEKLCNTYPLIPDCSMAIPMHPSFLVMVLQGI